MSTAALPLVQAFIERDAHAAGRTIELLEEEEGLALLASLPSDAAARVLPAVPARLAGHALVAFEAEARAATLARLEPGQIAAVLMALTEEERATIVDALDAKAKERVRELLTYPEGSAGRIMSTEFIAFHIDQRVSDTIEQIRALAAKGVPPSYGYILDREDKLAGVINMRDLVITPGHTTLDACARRDVFTLTPFMSREEVLDALTARRFFAAPVVDAEGHMLGVIRASQLVGEAQSEAGEDMLKMFGVGGDERPFSPVSYSLKKRLPWLHVNLLTAFMAAGVVAMFEDLIARITVLAVFLPVVAGQGGNAGAQSLAVVMRGLVMREIPKSKGLRLVAKEGLIGTISGVVTGLVTGLVAMVWHGNPMFGVVIGLAMIINLMAAGVSGAAIPLLMKRLGLDPAQSSNIILTTVTDVVGFFAFLGIAMLFQSSLV
ncbi:MAG: magnesium transporter [Planctomycetota bacterium]